MIKKSILLTLVIFINLFANQTKLYFNKNSISNAQTAVLYLEAKDITNPKLTILENKININFHKLNGKKNIYYALVPSSYYDINKKLKIIVSYTKNNKKLFDSIYLNVKEGTYKSEIIKVKSSKVTLNKRTKKRTKTEYSNAMKIYHTFTPKKLWKDKFILPLNSPITSAFGTKRVYNNTLKGYHSGTDFKAKVGTKIIAANDGIVVLTKNRFYAGNSIIIDHGQGIYTCYYHLSKFLVTKNQRVKRGQVIALSGKTGRVTGPHLHFSARVNSVQVDPLQLIEILNNL
ncbi:M23 family metallopeptidase [Arcobacter sp. CECT 8985]|uniref:M23 family metallopeptidase n=1 Tax=Arcobacter sp. CECT 8985 TaxID=1935424 RepID=UPI00100B163D|nr:M23 family metallopeptidase [Arcobacter sp. CECT 8985]RXJ88178.1 peptidase M23 [Arcobacter sp. CECT 8985]